MIFHLAKFSCFINSIDAEGINPLNEKKSCIEGYCYSLHVVLMFMVDTMLIELLIVYVDADVSFGSNDSKFNINDLFASPEFDALLTSIEESLDISADEKTGIAMKSN